MIESEAINEIEKILKEEFNLAKPDDLAFLESQIRHIATRIVYSILVKDNG